MNSILQINAIDSEHSRWINLNHVVDMFIVPITNDEMETNVGTMHNLKSIKDIPEEDKKWCVNFVFSDKTNAMSDAFPNAEDAENWFNRIVELKALPVQYRNTNSIEEVVNSMREKAKYDF